MATMLEFPEIDAVRRNEFCLRDVKLHDDKEKLNPALTYWVAKTH